MKHGKKISALLLCAALGLSGFAQAKSWSNHVSSLITPDATGNILVVENNGDADIQAANMNNSDSSMNCGSLGCNQYGGGSPEDITINLTYGENNGTVNVRGVNEGNRGKSMNCLGFVCQQIRGSD